ncbi:MAG: chromo domain-containing protein [Candidatus Pacebacteria bacterium]|nr:chromo domain-containing protein [Candidatus Paceibacterota bacterium]
MSRRNPIDLTQDEDDLSEVSFGCDDLFPPAVEVTEEGDEIYRVERIVGLKRTGAGVYYLVKWFGFPLDDSTMVHESEMGDCAETVADFRKEQGLPVRR